MPTNRRTETGGEDKMFRFPTDVTFTSVFTLAKHCPKEDQVEDEETIVHRHYIGQLKLQLNMKNLYRVELD